MTRLAVLLLSVLAITAARAADPPAQASAVATFAAGCYWCVESDFDKVKGVLDTTSGFMGGTTKNPTYEEVGTGKTGHTEVVRVTYDPKTVSYQQLLDYYWHNVDPFDATGQFCDRGSQYRPAIFVYDADQRALAEASKKAVEAKLSKTVVVEINAASDFTAAHDQNFYKTNSLRYRYYRTGCGRDARLDQIWGAERSH